MKNNAMNIEEMNSSKKATLKIEFPSQEHLEEFTVWLANSGEQSYWEGFGPTVDFIYHHPQDERFPQNDKRRYANSEFCRDNTILTEARDEKDE
jgi:hypothetical protein